jgi:hypothetical protein
MASIELEDELDDLYRTAPAAFVAARNELSRRLKLAGRKEDADSVAKLARPTPMAWVVNQLALEGAEELRELRDAGAALREAQEVLGDGGSFAERKRGHQSALKAATERGMEIAEVGGTRPNAAFRRKLELTLNLLCAAVDVKPPPGRMSADLEPSGFDALSTAAVAQRRSPDPDEGRAKASAATRAALAAVEKEIARLEDEAKSARSRHERTVRMLEEAERAASTARDARDEARASVEASERRLNEARAARDAALAELKG